MSPGPEIQVLFRFRDLIAGTLAEHRKVVEQHGACWWGWWKRPNEESPSALWAALKSPASMGKPVSVGLFHSGAGTVYTAEVVDEIVPSPSGERVVVSEGEEVLVLDYYRNSPFSRAWLRIRETGPEPKAFFDSYSYDSVPQIPGYSEVVLEALQGKSSWMPKS